MVVGVPLRATREKRGREAWILAGSGSKVAFERPAPSSTTDPMVVALSDGTAPASAGGKRIVVTVSKPLRFEALELCLSEKQTPQVIVFIRSRSNQGERLDRAGAQGRRFLVSKSVLCPLSSAKET